MPRCITHGSVELDEPRIAVGDGGVEGGVSEDDGRVGHAEDEGEGEEQASEHFALN